MALMALRIVLVGTCGGIPRFAARAAGACGGGSVTRWKPSEEEPAAHTPDDGLAPQDTDAVSDPGVLRRALSLLQTLAKVDYSVQFSKAKAPYSTRILRH